MSVTRLRTVKLLSEITDDYFYLEDLIEKLGMNQATESKALKDAREQVRMLSTSVNLPSCYCFGMCFIPPSFFSLKNLKEFYTTLNC